MFWNPNDGTANDSPQRTLASTLIARVLDTGAMDRETLAGALIVSPARLERFRDQREPIPPERQMLLALVVVERVPPLARFGRQLRTQVRAAAAYHASDVQVHSQGPPEPWR